MTTLFYKRKTIDGVKKLKRISYSSLLILEEAEKHHIKWEKIPYTGLFKLEYKQQVKYFHFQIPSETTAFASYSCKNKRITKEILLNANLSVSNGYSIQPNDKKEKYLKIFKNLKKPLVIKPINDHQGNNVFININTQKKYLETIKKIYNAYSDKKINLLVEEMFIGDEYRILATQKKILSVIKRIPANVDGDGKSTIEELIKLKNQDPIRLKVPTYHQIIIDQNLIEFLEKQKLTFKSIIEKNQKVFLRPSSPLNMRLGGDTIDVTADIHPTVKKIIQRTMDSIPGLSLAGIDYMTKDITAPQTNKKYIIIELNTSPSLDWNQYPLKGPKKEIAFEFLKVMFPGIK